MANKNKVLIGGIMTALFFGSLFLFPKEFYEEKVSYIDDKKPQISIVIVGDIMLDRDIRRIGEESGYKSILENFNKTKRKANFFLGNLEGPVTASSSVSLATLPGSSDNYKFTINPLALEIFEGDWITILSIGNNHIYDFGEWGVRSTEQNLKSKGILFFGSPIKNGADTLIIEKDNTRVAFISFNEFFEPEIEEVINEIEEAKKMANYVFVYSHWGEEYVKNPGDDLRIKARMLIDAGADAVFGSHPHVIGEIEEYNSKRIYYSLGNFIFDQYWSKDVSCGLLVNVKIQERDLIFDEEYWGFDRERGGGYRCMLE